MSVVRRQEEHDRRRRANCRPETLPVSQVANAANILVDRVYDAYSDFVADDWPLCAGHLAVLADTVRLVRALKCVLDHLDDDGDDCFRADRIATLIDDYSACRAAFHKIKTDMRSLRTAERRRRLPDARRFR